MIGHERRRGHSALRPPPAAIYCRANDAESARPLWIERSGGTNWALRRPGANPGTCPVARVGRASPSAHPVGRQPIRGPVPARTRTPVRRGLPGPAGRRRGTPHSRAVRPCRLALRPRVALAAGVLLLPPPAGATAAPPHGSAVPASPSAAAPPVSPPSVAAAAVGRPLVDLAPIPSLTAREGGSALPAATRGLTGFAKAQLIRCASCGS